MPATIQEIQQKITPILKKYGVDYAAVFGSVARRQGTAESDVDIMVRVTHLPHGIWGFVGLKEDLEKVLHKKVDLVSEQGIGRQFASRIKRDLVTVYEK